MQKSTCASSPFFSHISTLCSSKRPAEKSDVIKKSVCFSDLDIFRAKSNNEWINKDFGDRCKRSVHSVEISLCMGLVACYMAPPPPNAVGMNLDGFLMILPDLVVVGAVGWCSSSPCNCFSAECSGFGVFLGRPRFLGCTGAVSSGTTAGLSRSTETVSSFSPTCILKNLEFLSTTLYGPSYFGVRGRGIHPSAPRPGGTCASLLEYARGSQSCGPRFGLVAGCSSPCGDLEGKVRCPVRPLGDHWTEHWTRQG